MADVRDQLISEYFEQGLTQKQIQEALEFRQIFISQRHLRRILFSLGLSRRLNRTNPEIVIDFIARMLLGSAQMHGYRFMHQRCINAGFTVSRHTVREIMAVLDPVGVDFRRNGRLVRRRYSGRGPNNIWHVDSYDKLTPFGICINGCIDGYSRYIIWMDAYSTNSDPKIIANYFLSKVQDIKGCPRILRVDNGTENVHMCRIQELLHEENGINPNNCVIRGRSTANQRIERWWGSYRRGNGEYWITLFHLLRSEGYFTGEDLDKELIRFCFLNTIQVDYLTLNCRFFNETIYC